MFYLNNERSGDLVVVLVHAQILAHVCKHRTGFNCGICVGFGDVVASATETVDNDAVANEEDSNHCGTMQNPLVGTLKEFKN